jgi:hypothetical protein
MLFSSGRIKAEKLAIGASNLPQASTLPHLRVPPPLSLYAPVEISLQISSLSPVLPPNTGFEIIATSFLLPFPWEVLERTAEMRADRECIS